MADTVPIFVQEVRDMLGKRTKLHVSADNARVHIKLKNLLKEYDCDRAPVAVGHDFQLPIEWSFGRAKVLAHKAINKLSHTPSKNELWRIWKGAWTEANTQEVVAKDIKKMRSVWDLIIQSGGELVSREQLKGVK